jgi:hypothetical protein
MIEEMNIKMIDCNTGRTAVPWYDSTAISIYMFMYDPMFCKMLDCRETGTLKHWNIGMLECWNIKMLVYRNICIQEHRNIGMFAKTFDSSRIYWMQQAIKQINEQITA